ncbi:hypothetical protein NQ314_015073 [Rhamnusium bicolor]|uniref:Transcription factor Adf-1 n=1 Tax=Rhamnusium bicolor TaxID=1586634 RepID=A0AAV8WZC4_9CUCU|nr:hypothetical protein NQ314_015073 [Rhamnusium bicolor]
MGGRKKMKPNVVPHIFDYQPDRKRAFSQPPRSAALKRAKRRIVDDVVASTSTLSAEDLGNIQIDQSSIQSCTKMYSGPKQQALDWSFIQDEVLIDFVKTHECLYNVQAKEYRKTKLKQSLWHEIGGILNKTDIDCSKRWAYVRDYYIRRRGKPSTGSCGEAAKKRSEQLSFLDSLSSNKKSSSTISNIDDTENAEFVENSIDVLSRKDAGVGENLREQMVKEEVWIDEESHLSNENDTIDNISRVETETADILEAKYSDKRLKLKQIVERQEDSPIAPQKQDENDLFFAAMAKIVQKLPEIQQAEIRLQVGTLVGNAEIQYLSRAIENHRPPSTSSCTTSSATFEDYPCEGVFVPSAPSATAVVLKNEPNNSSCTTNLF